MRKTPPCLTFYPNQEKANRFPELVGIVVGHLVNFIQELSTKCSYEAVEDMFDPKSFIRKNAVFLFDPRIAPLEKKLALDRLFRQDIGYIGIHFRVEYAEGGFFLYQTTKEETQFVRPLTTETHKFFTSLFRALERNGFGKFEGDEPEEPEQQQGLSKESLDFLSKPSANYF